MYTGAPLKLSIFFAVYFSSLLNFGACENKNATLPMEPIYKKCKVDATKPEEQCAEDLTCTDFTGLAASLGQRCALKDPKPVNTVTCRAKVPGYNQWTYQAKSPKVTHSKGKPKAGWEKAGCYLEKGQICSMSAHDYAGAETHEICKVDHGCQRIQKDWGFCRYNSSPKLHALPTLCFFTILFSSIVLS